MRREYEMTEDEFNGLLDACKPTPVIMIGRYVPPSPQENANRYWQQLADKYGFIYDTVKPVEDKDQRFFTAEEKEID